MVRRSLIGSVLVLALVLSGWALSPISASAADIVIKLAQGNPPDQAYGMYAHGFADKMKANSGGRIIVENLDGGVMGSEQDNAHQVQLGTIQMAAVTSNNVGQLAPSINVMVLPYLNATMEDVVGDKGLLAPGPYRDELNRRVIQETGSMFILGGFTNSFRLFFTKNKCVTKLADLQGLKIRIPKNPVMEKMWKAWGVSTYPVAWSETFTAIQQGVVDAFDSPMDVILRNGFYDDINYIIETHYTPQAAVLVVNLPWFNSLSKKDQELIRKTADENDRWHYNWVMEDQKTLKKTLMEKHGIKFCQLEDEDIWKEKAKAIWPELYKYVGGGEAWVQQTLEYKKTGKME